MSPSTTREGSLEAPTRHPIDWQNPSYWDEEALFSELERVFDLCHGCRRCVSLCNSFPTLFDLVDESETMEVDGVAKEDYWKVVEHCYLCDLCYMTKCPYIPPHEWNIDFPHLMLRAKAFKHKHHKTRFRDKLLSSTDTVGSLAGIPVVVNAVNAANQSKTMRGLLEKTLDVDASAHVPKYHSQTARKRLARLVSQAGTSAIADDVDQGKVALYMTCYGNYNEPQLCEDLVKVFQHNNITVRITEKEQCCGMPKLELGDLDSVRKSKEANIPVLAKLVDEGWKLVAPVPSCVLMFKQELPLLFPDDADVLKVRDAFYDPFEYLMLRHKEGQLNTSFANSLGKVSYHVACHLRVQNIGLKTKDILQLIPETQVEAIERCSGHDGTYAVKKEFHQISMKIARPVVNRVKQSESDYYASDCPMAGHQIENGLEYSAEPTHPISLLRKAYGI